MVLQPKQPRHAVVKQLQKGETVDPFSNGNHGNRALSQ